jgi:hypothetical protein
MNLIVLIFLLLLLNTMHCFQIIPRRYLYPQQFYSIVSIRKGGSKGFFSSKRKSLFANNDDHFETSTRTLIDENPSPWKISHDSGVMLIGSCFSTNIYEKLKKSKFSMTYSNPQGILFNPISIANCLDNIICRRKFSEEDLFLDHNQNHPAFHSYQHHSDYDAFSQVDGLEKINQDMEKAHIYVKKAQVLFITLGTAKIYSLKTNQDFIVANCHKRKYLIPSHFFNLNFILP